MSISLAQPAVGSTNWGSDVNANWQELLDVFNAGAETISRLGFDAISPTSLSASQNDYNPSGLSSASLLRLTASAAVGITGLQGGSAGRLLFVHNIGSNDITLADESSSSRVLSVKFRTLV